MQLCVLVIFGARHIGNALIILLLLLSLAGYMFGGRNLAFVSSFGLASYSGLSLLGALWFTQAESGFVCWFLLAVIILVSILNIIISFWIMKRLYNNLGRN